MALHPNWKSLSTVALPWKTFIREGESYIPQKKKRAVTVTKQSLTGDEAKQLYEEIVKSETRPYDDNKACSSGSVFVKPPEKRAKKGDEAMHNQVKPKTLNEVEKSIWINKLMKAAQSNDVPIVSSLLKENPEFPINAVDQYGWTALMCASASGALDVVKFLLQNGAETSVRDKSGNCCLTIAKRMKYFQIIDCINSKSTTKKQQSESVSNSGVNSFFCDVCKRSFSDSMGKHIASTVHLFNSHPGKSRTFYSIPESNRGFQILLKAGWDKEKGLGPEGSGSKFPLKTVLRKDRRGLGQPNKTQPRVTHFDAFSTAAVRTERKCKGRKERANSCLREKRKERLIRKELS